MDITLTERHLATLEKLRAIAKKHGGYIYISFLPMYSTDLSDLDQQTLSKLGFPKEIDPEYFKHFFDLKSKSVAIESYKYDFELCVNHLHNVISFEDLTINFCNLHCYLKDIEKTLIEDWEVATREDNSINKHKTSMSFPSWIKETLKLINNYLDPESFSQNFSARKQATIMSGFKGLNPDDYHIYREGMAVKFFGDAVCDFLHEPRIEETY